MKAFAWRHPNLITAWYAALWFWTGYLVVTVSWWWKPLMVLANFCYWQRTGTWYRRTGQDAT